HDAARRRAGGAVERADHAVRIAAVEVLDLAGAVGGRTAADRGLSVPGEVGSRRVDAGLTALALGAVAGDRLALRRLGVADLEARIAAVRRVADLDADRLFTDLFALLRGTAGRVALQRRRRARSPGIGRSVGRWRRGGVVSAREAGDEDGDEGEG